jgi:hypothetical protein
LTDYGLGELKKVLVYAIFKLSQTEFIKLDSSLPVRQPINPGPELMIPAGIGFTHQNWKPVVM